MAGRSPIIHNSFYVRNTRKENLSTLFGLSQGTDMDMYDYEFGPGGKLKVIHKKVEPEN